MAASRFFDSNKYKKRSNRKKNLPLIGVTYRLLTGGGHGGAAGMEVRGAWRCAQPRGWYNDALSRSGWLKACGLPVAVAGTDDRGLVAAAVGPVALKGTDWR